MTEKRDSFSIHWTSERLGKDIENLNLLDHYYEDNDPRIRLTTDRWGDEVIIVGYSDPIEFPFTLPNGETKLSPQIIAIRIRDNCLGHYHPESIDQTEYPEYVSKPFVHPDYDKLNREDDRRQREKRKKQK